LVPLHFVEFPSSEHFVASYDFEDLEPFTLVVLEDSLNYRLLQIVWDGENASIEVLPSHVSRIWSSATLYDAKAQAWRKELFKEWLLNNKPINQPEAILTFHQKAGKEDVANAICMRRPFVATLSITTLHRSAHTCEMIYRDLVHQKQEQLCLIC
jgi:hypothetical protein